MEETSREWRLKRKGGSIGRGEGREEIWVKSKVVYGVVRQTGGNWGMIRNKRKRRLGRERGRGVSRGKKRAGGGERSRLSGVVGGGTANLGGKARWFRLQVPLMVGAVQCEYGGIG